MIQTIKAKATVQSGGLVAVHSDELPESATVEVIVLVESVEESKKPLREPIDLLRTAKPDEPDVQKPQQEPKRLSRFVGVMKGKGSFSSAADVDEYIRQERDSWHD